MQSASILKDQSFERIQRLSGVNIDEEAANLLMYQQYYSAAARVI
ncbi:flagellar basal body rod C-terminal domain-containing protein, partial [Psychromonas arctica]